MNGKKKRRRMRPLGATVLAVSCLMIGCVFGILISRFLLFPPVTPTESAVAAAETAEPETPTPESSPETTEASAPDASTPEPSSDFDFPEEPVAETMEVDVVKHVKVDDGWTDDGKPSLRRSNFDYTETETEKKIYSYVQGREEYYEDPTWCGPWAYLEEGGQGFYAFGCGLCCMSNMVNTLSKPKNTPGQMLEYAKKYTDYYPQSGTGALSWEQMQSLSDHFGLKGTLHLKPEEYEEFQYQVSAADTTVILISSHNDKTLWDHTSGHYVNIWKYDPATDTVFVTDSSGLYNRVRVPLSNVYAALKTSSPYQYMTVLVPG